MSKFWRARMSKNGILDFIDLIGFDEEKFEDENEKK